MKDLLSTYAQSTGQLLNPSKCSILFSTNCPGAVSESIKHTLGILREVFEPKYLGLPVPQGRMHKGRFGSTQERLSKRLVDWSEQYTSTGTKEILIKSMAQAILTYVMSVFKLSASVCDDLTQIMRQYWWEWKTGRGRWLG